jgi:hypothetical protein
MILLTENIASPFETGWLVSLLTVFISGIISFIVALLKTEHDSRKLTRQHKHEMEKLRAEKQSQFDLEMDKMQAKALAGLYKPLKYISAREANPNAVLGIEKGDNNKQTVLYRTNTQSFLSEINDYLFSEYGQLFLPRKLRRMIFKLRGILDDILKQENSENEIIKLHNKKIIDELKELISGEEDIHHELRKHMGTIDRPLQVQDQKNESEKK